MEISGMFFSVLIPVYQVKDYLCQCVDSVLNQSEQDFEILLVDDGSTDKTLRTHGNRLRSVP